MTDERITAYLLEELTEQESEQFEEQCFAQDEWPAEVDAAEQDLIDAYLRDELTSDRRRRFQERYLTTDARKARVLAAQTFHKTLRPVQPKSAWKELLRDLVQRPYVPQAAIAILVVAIGVGVFWPRSQTFTRIDLAMSTSNRGSVTQTTIVPLPLTTTRLQVHLKLPQPAPDTTGYRVQFEDGNGPLHELKIESQDAQSVVVSIPADELKPNQYLLRLFKNNDEVGNYFFTAEPRAR